MNKLDFLDVWVKGGEIQWKTTGPDWLDMKSYKEVRESVTPTVPYAFFDSGVSFRIKPKSRYLNIYEPSSNIRGSWTDNVQNAYNGRLHGCLGYLEDKQDGSVFVFNTWED